MADYALTRRQFLRSTTRIGLTLTLATALCPPVRTVQADEGSFISILGGLEIFRQPDVQEFLGTGIGALWVAGSYLNVFAHNLNFSNLPPELILKYRLAGAEWKSFPAAKGLGETIPAPIRAGGPEALWKFHKGKDWSHIIPKSWGAQRPPKTDLVELREEQDFGRQADEPGGHCRCQGCFEAGGNTRHHCSNT